MKVCVKYSTMRELKVWKCSCENESERTVMFAIANVVLKELGKYVKVQKTWFEEE